jgi:hypothetical protein
MSTYLSHLDSAPAPGPMKAGKDLVYQQPYPKRRFSQDTRTEYAGYAVDGVPLFPHRRNRSFFLPISQHQAIGTLRRASARALSLLLKSLGRNYHPGLSESSPLQSQSRETQTHDFLIPARFGIWSGRRHPHAGSVGAPASRSDKPDRLPAPRERSGGAVDQCAAATRRPHARHMHVAPADPPALVIAYFDIT